MFLGTGGASAKGCGDFFPRWWVAGFLSHLPLEIFSSTRFGMGFGTIDGTRVGGVRFLRRYRHHRSGTLESRSAARAREKQTTPRYRKEKTNSNLKEHNTLVKKEN